MLLQGPAVLGLDPLSRPGIPLRQEFHSTERHLPIDSHAQHICTASALTWQVIVLMKLPFEKEFPLLADGSWSLLAQSA